MKTGSRNKAKVAIANKIARAVYSIISSPGELFHERGYQKVYSDDKKITNHINSLKKLGVNVEYVVLEKILKANKNIELKAS